MKQKQKQKNKIIDQSWIKVFSYTIGILFSIAFCILIFLFYLSSNLPSLNELQNFNPDQVSKFISADDELIHKLQSKKKWEKVKIGDAPKSLINSLIAMEDKEFYSHNGFNFKATARAIFVDVFSLTVRLFTGKRASIQGASTITQQLARSMYDTVIGQEKSILRKIKELITAFNIEQAYTKSEILELYINSVFLGHGRHGVQSASRLYFDKDISELTVDESAMIIGLLPAPNIYSPYSRYRINTPKDAIDRCKRRRDLVLKVLYNDGYIDYYEYTYNKDKKIKVQEKSIASISGYAPYFSEHVRKELEGIQKDLSLNVYKDGLVIQTTLDTRVQDILTNAFNKTMEINQRKLNNEFVKNPDKLDRALKGYDYDKDTLLTILKNNETIPVSLRNRFLVQGSAIALDPASGNIIAMIGGRQEKEYLDLHGFNRATQAKRQPGSVFKPFIYLTAIDNGFTPKTELLNQPLVVFIDDSTKWNPQNWDNSTGLLTTLREGLRRSLNLISVRIVQELVTPKEVKKLAKSFGFSTRIDAVDAIALGVSDVIPLEMASAYGTIANNGIYNTPMAITHIADKHGRVVKNFSSDQIEAIDESVNYIVLDMMKDVVDNGTGKKIRSKYKFNSPMAGKTGTTNDKTDAWFIGFTPDIVIAVWVGLDDPLVSLGKRQFGSSAALPIFGDAITKLYDQGYYVSGDMNKVLDSDKDWDIPVDIVEAEICSETHKSPTRFCKKDREIFLKKHRPSEPCDKHYNPFTRFKEK